MPALVLTSVIVGFLLFGRLRRLGDPAVGIGATPASPTDHAAGALAARRTTIVVPARNEEASLGNLLHDIAALDPAPARVVVVDDRSTDRTREIAWSHEFATVVDAPPLPAGWRGKPWACHLGAESAIRGGPADGILVFLDADVRLRPAALGLLLDEAERGGVVSVQPFHEVPTAVEHLSALFNVVSLMGVGAGTDAPSAMFGPVICCTVADYERVGGHSGVRSSVTEDVALAHRFLATGIGVRVLGGGDAVRFRMYPTGLRSLVEGWSKNMATGAAAVPWWRTVGVALWIAGLVSASMAAVGLVTGAATSTAELVAVVSAALGLGVLLGRVGTFRWWAVVGFPILVAGFVVIFARSVWLTHVRHSVTWRGRTIDLRSTPDDTAPTVAHHHE